MTKNEQIEALRGVINKLLTGYNYIATGAVPANEVKEYAAKMANYFNRPAGG